MFFAATDLPQRRVRLAVRLAQVFASRDAFIHLGSA